MLLPLTKKGWVKFASLPLLLSLCALPISAQETICDPGDTEVRNLDFMGNSSFSDSELAMSIVTTPSSSLYRIFRVLGTRRCADRFHLPFDQARLTAFYRDRGFPGVRVSLDTTRVGANAINVRFDIDEGEPIVIESFTLRGLQGVSDSAAIAASITARQGERFDEFVLDRDLATVRSALRNIGYPRGDAAASYSVDTLRRAATVAIEVLPRSLTRISNIIVRIERDSANMNEPPAISEETVRRLLGFKSGDLVSARKLLDGQRNLFQTDAYRNVQIRPAPDSLQPRGDSLMVIQATLVEGTMHELRPGAGWGTLDCFRAQATYTDRSFFGAARQLQVTGRVSKIGIGHPLDGAEYLCRKEARDDIYSDKLNFRVGVSLRQPGILGLGPHDAPTLSIYSEQRSEYLAYFRSVPFGASASISRDLSPRARLALPLTFSYVLEYGSTQAQPAIYCALFNLCGEEERERIRQRQRLAVASVGIIRDSRDFVLDPSTGSASQLEWRHASRTIFSDASLQFNSFMADYRRYWSLGGGVVLSARLRGGLVLGQQLRLQIRQDDGDLEEVAVSGYVPPAERMYAGGPSSVRGFRFNELGPEVYIVSRYDTIPAPEGGDTVYFRAPNEVRPDRSVPTGGNTMVIGNLEARVPSPFLSDIVSYAIFVDAGEVWNRGRTAGTAEARFDGIKITPGLGLRVSSPVGPIRVDVGYNGYSRRPGAAYFDAPVGAGGVAPLYCVSPENTVKVVPATEVGRPATQITGSGVCGSTFLPEGRRGLRRLTFNFSIGQAF